ncbi:MAG: ribonuclease R, partial [Alphaproteobacteria bacterium]
AVGGSGRHAGCRAGARPPPPGLIGAGRPYVSRTPPKSAPLPSKEALLAHIRESPTPLGKREIARAFGVKGSDRLALKAMLRELAAEGAIDRGRGRKVGAAGALPDVMVLELIGTDTDGEMLARPIHWRETEPLPTIIMDPDRRGVAALGQGDRVLARLSRLPEGGYLGRIVKSLQGAPDRVLGVIESDGPRLRLRSVDRRDRQDFLVPMALRRGAEAGELVLARPLPGRRLGLREVEVMERIGSADQPKAASLIALHLHDIPTEFPPSAIAQAEAAKPVTLGSRTDLRAIPLVTIDDTDARDFDDAVWAEPDPDPANQGGHRLIVAIADVAHYVRPGDALDKSAYRRGNSVYFPDRVVPMLPEALSNGLCSLKPGEDRSCLYVEIQIDANGRKLRHRFGRGLMRSAARLTYRDVQAIQDGHTPGSESLITTTIVAPLYAAYRTLKQARDERGALDLDLPERRVVLCPDGRVDRIEKRPRFDSHRLIEDFMIQANVCAAETLEQRRMPCMFRVHDAPDPARLDILRSFVQSLGLNFAKGQRIPTAQFNALLGRVTDTPHATAVHQAVLRTQSLAIYDPVNIGHYGLALARYAHFTSPIRRYADLLVHRALIAALRLGEGGLPPDAASEFGTAARHISDTERRATAAERDAMDRYTAAFLSERVGATFAARISGVSRFGVFVTLDDTGADGLVPVSSLPPDRYDHDEDRHSLAGRTHGLVFRLGDPVEVRLAEARPITGGLIFHLLQGPTGRVGRGSIRLPPHRSRRKPR